LSTDDKPIQETTSGAVLSPDSHQQSQSHHQRTVLSRDAGRSPRQITGARSSSSSNASTTTANTLLNSLLVEQRDLQGLQSALKSDIEVLTSALTLVRMQGRSSEIELDGLIGTWRLAARQAAEELWVPARERVNRMGGLEAWRNWERQRALARYEAFHRDDDGMRNADDERLSSGEQDLSESEDAAAAADPLSTGSEEVRPCAQWESWRQ